MKNDKTYPTIYGVDPNKEVTSLMVRDAIIECFRQAHCADAGVGTEDEDTNCLYCKEIVKKAFDDADADFNNPTKEDIMNVLGKLAEFAKKFRDQKMVQKHMQEIMKLVEKL